MPRPKAPGEVWLKQAESDLMAAERLAGGGEKLYCQTVSKCQQAVEKAVKGIASDLEARGIPLIGLPATAGSKHSALTFTEAFRRIAPSSQNHEVKAHISGLLNERGVMSGICDLDALVPAFPKGGALHPRNTEYPYQQNNGTWRAPAEHGSFGPQEVERFRGIAEIVVGRTSRIISAIARRPT